MRELPDDIRVPLHELQADVRYIFGRRVTVYSSTASIIADAVEKKFAALEAAIRNRLSSVRCVDIVIETGPIVQVTPAQLPSGWDAER